MARTTRFIYQGGEAAVAIISYSDVKQQTVLSSPANHIEDENTNLTTKET